MFAVQKITQRYDPVQDRIAFTMESGKSEVLLLWLTQRIANRLAAALTKWLDKDEKTVVESGQSTSSLHAWKQSAAQAKMAPRKPVDPAVAKVDALVKTVELARRPNAYTLIFKWGTEEAARLTMNQTGLRQWLIILHRQYDRAGWTKQAWPEWFTADEGNSAVKDTQHVLH